MERIRVSYEEGTWTEVFSYPNGSEVLSSLPQVFTTCKELQVVSVKQVAM